MKTNRSMIRAVPAMQVSGVLEVRGPGHIQSLNISKERKAGHV